MKKGGTSVRYLWIILGAGAVATSFLACEEETKMGGITGNVKDDGTNVSGAFVLLLDEGKIVTAETPLSNASITNKDGDYTMVLVEPEKYYYVAAVKDEDGDTKYTPATDPIGYFGRYNKETKTWVPASIYIGSGEKKTGINVADMYIIPGA
jgi:hypothetical protein